MNSKPKKLLLLGGLRYLLPVIEAAHAQGYYVITADYLPDNIAHRYSDEYYNVSIVDREAVLSLARSLEIDGIMSFAVDPGVDTAAYVAEKLGLPFAGSYKSVHILQNKDLFRRFLTDNGFNVPKSGGYSSLSEAEADLGRFVFPVIVKPTDSAGSKGVTRVDSPADFPSAFDHALAYSISGRVIVEEFIEKLGCSSDCDCFSVDGRMEVITFSAQHFDSEAANPYTPSAYSWPSTFTSVQETELCSELQRLVTLLGLRTSIYNIETRIGIDGRPYIMEVSPRGGGNRLAEMVKYVYDSDLITAYVRASVGDSIAPLSLSQPDGFWAEVILHASADGAFCRLDIDESIRPFVVETDLWVKQGQSVNGFNGANDAIGTLVLRFPDLVTQQAALASISSWCKVIIK